MSLFNFETHIGRWRVLLQTRDIHNKAVTEDKLADEAVTEEKLADEAVTERSLANDAVTNDKLAPHCVTNDKLAPEAVTTEKLPPHCVTNDKLAPEVVEAKQLILSDASIEIGDEGEIILAYFQGSGVIDADLDEDTGEISLTIQG